MIKTFGEREIAKYSKRSLIFFKKYLYEYTMLLKHHKVPIKQVLLANIDFFYFGDSDNDVRDITVEYQIKGKAFYKVTYVIDGEKLTYRSDIKPKYLRRVYTVDQVIGFILYKMMGLKTPLFYFIDPFILRNIFQESNLYEIANSPFTAFSNNFVSLFSGDVVFGSLNISELDNECVKRVYYVHPFATDAIVRSSVNSIYKKFTNSEYSQNFAFVIALPDWKDIIDNVNALFANDNFNILMFDAHNSIYNYDEDSTVYFTTRVIKFVLIYKNAHFEYLVPRISQWFKKMKV